MQREIGRIPTCKSSTLGEMQAKNHLPRPHVAEKERVGSREALAKCSWE
jgi:hypothetical protein